MGNPAGWVATCHSPHRETELGTVGNRCGVRAASRTPTTDGPRSLTTPVIRLPAGHGRVRLTEGPRKPCPHADDLLAWDQEVGANLKLLPAVARSSQDLAVIR